ncbi:MAG: hypothetical protein B7Y82_11650 [Sphingomonadales bacterium 32-65-25]|nr:MAG: hypothetical protein B7Z50_01100 [Sphingomonadales bacterium 12-62-5]OYX77013.1 MAG: hypothetical protein B7Y82_11650 [Sphingomonadales bacterium 32-65-25]
MPHRRRAPLDARLFGARRRLAGARGGADRALSALRSFGAGRTVAGVWPCPPGWAFAALGAFGPVRALSALRAFGPVRAAAALRAFAALCAGRTFGTGRPRRAIVTLWAVATWRSLVGFGALAAVAPARSALVAARQRRCTRRTLVSAGARAGARAGRRALTRIGAGGACWAFAAGWFAGWSHGASHAAGPPDCQKEKGPMFPPAPPLSFG